MDKLSVEMAEQFERIKNGDEIVSRDDIKNLNEKIRKMALENISNEVFNYKNSTKLSNEKISSILGYQSHTTATNYVMGEDIPPIETLIKLSVLTNKSLDELVFGSQIAKSNIEEIILTLSDNIQDKQKLDIKKTEYELSEIIEILYKTLRKHNSGGLFYIPDDFIEFLKYTIKENDFISDISLKTYNIVEEFKKSENIALLKSSKDWKEFKDNISKEKMQDIENIIPKKRDRTKFNDFIIKFIYNKLTSEK